MTAPNAETERLAIAAYEYAESMLGPAVLPWGMASARTREYYRGLVEVVIAAQVDGSGEGS